jgi:hypothetical protein
VAPRPSVAGLTVDSVTMAALAARYHPRPLSDRGNPASLRLRVAWPGWLAVVLRAVTGAG